MNLFCLLSIRSAVAELLKPLVGKGRGKKRRDGRGRGRRENGGKQRGIQTWPCVV